jgi:hypothetical protein
MGERIYRINIISPKFNSNFQDIIYVYHMQNISNPVTHLSSKAVASMTTRGQHFLRCPQSLASKPCVLEIYYILQIVCAHKRAMYTSTGYMYIYTIARNSTTHRFSGLYPKTSSRVFF